VLGISKLRTHTPEESFLQGDSSTKLMNRPTFRDKKPNEDYMNRRLIRPSLADLKDKMTVRSQKRKPAPQEQTNAESFYYLKQMQNKTPMVVMLDDGQQLRGIIEWYDRNCIKVNRETEPNLLVFKHCIRFMYKENEDKSSDE
jgi:host factor-I protein